MCEEERRRAREPRTSIFFRTLAPGLPSADILTPDTPGGSPPTFTAPARRPWVDTLVTKGHSAYNHHLLPRFNAIARRAYAMHAPQLGVLDVADPMERRVSESRACEPATLIRYAGQMRNLSSVCP